MQRSSVPFSISVSRFAAPKGNPVRKLPKIIFILILAIGLTGLSVVYSANAGRAKPNRSLRSSIPTATLANQPREIPDYVKFSFVFHHLENIKERFGPLARYKEKMGLYDEDFSQLTAIARDHESEVGELDIRAQAIIADFHNQYPPGAGKLGVKLPPPPAELKELQERRNAASLRYGARLHSQLGETKFGRFKEFLDREFPAKSEHVDQNTMEVEK